MPGMNPEVLDVEDELLLDTVVDSPELLVELLEVPPAPPGPLSMVTSVLQPACISTPSVTSKALANTSSDERRGVMSERFMDDPPT